MKLRKRALITVSAFGASLALAASAGLVGCGSDSTAGRRVYLEARAQAGALAFVNAYGFEVELFRVVVSIGSLRYLQGAPVARTGGLDRWFGIRKAHAHPGHYVAGGVVGEMLQPVVVELTQEPVAIGGGLGVTGNALSALFEFRAPTHGPLAAELGARVVLVEGSATREGAVRRFRASAEVSDVADVHGQPYVAGCPFTGAVEADGIVTVTIDGSLWFDQVDFDLVEDESDAFVELVRGELPHAAFVRGLKKAAAYGFAYRPGPE